MTPVDNPRPITLRTNSKLSKRPSVAFPLAAFVIVDVLAVLMLLEAWR